MEPIALRVAARHQAGEVPKDYAEEILDMKIEGKKLSAHVEDFLTDLIAKGQKISKVMDEACKTVEGYHDAKGGDKISAQTRLGIILPVVKQVWGNDPATGPLTRIVALGDYVF